MACLSATPEEKDFLKRLYFLCVSQDFCGARIRELFENVPTSVDISGLTDELGDPLPIFHHWED